MNKPTLPIEDPQQAGCLPRHCSPAAQCVREEIWAQFCDWWTGREHAKEVKDFAFTIFALGFEAGEMATVPLKIMLERLMTWWRCDGGMDSLGQIMDDLEGIIEPSPAP